MPTRATLDGLLRRGLDTNTAARLVVNGYRIQDLQNKTVPEETFLKVLHESNLFVTSAETRIWG